MTELTDKFSNPRRIAVHSLNVLVSVILPAAEAWIDGWHGLPPKLPYSLVAAPITGLMVGITEGIILDEDYGTHAGAYIVGMGGALWSPIASMGVYNVTYHIASASRALF